MKASAISHSTWHIIIVVVLLSTTGARAQQNQDQNPVVHGIFAYVAHSQEYAGWKAIAPYVQKTCRHCHKTITTQLFLNAGGDTVMLSSQKTCHKSANGKHEYMAEVFNKDGSLQNGEEITTSGPSDEDSNPIYEENEDITNNINTQSDTNSNDNKDKPETKHAEGDIDFNIDSLHISSNICFFYTYGNKDEVVVLDALININSPDKSVVLPPVKISLYLLPSQNYYIAMSLSNISEQIKTGYDISVVISDKAGTPLKSMMATLNGGKKGMFGVVF